MFFTIKMFLTVKKFLKVWRRREIAMSETIVQLGKGIIMLENNYDANLTCIELDDNLVFIDTGRNYDLALKFRIDMEKRFNKKASHLLITHYHFDHYGGIEAFKDTEIVAAESGYNQFLTDINFYLTKEKREKYVEMWKKQAKESNQEVPISRQIHWEYFPKANLISPTIIVKDKFEFGDNNRKIAFEVTGGHSKCSAIVHLPLDNLIHVGDNLATNPERGKDGFPGYPMQFYRYGLNEKTISVLKQIEKLNIDTVIPGHGQVVSLKEVSNTVEYFDDLFREMKLMFRENIEPDSSILEERLVEFYNKSITNWVETIRQQYKTIVQEQTINEIEEKKRQMLEFISNKDLEKVLKFYTEDFELFLPNGFVIKGVGNYRNNFPSFDDIIEHSICAEQYYFLDNSVVENSKYKSILKNGKDLLNYEKTFIYFWKKQGKSWVISKDITVSESVY